MWRQTALVILVLVASTAAAPSPWQLGGFLRSPLTLPPYLAQNPGSFLPFSSEPCYNPEPCIPPCPEPCIPPYLEKPPGPLPRPSQLDRTLPTPTPGGNGPIGVVISKSNIPERLRSAGFQVVQVPGGLFYITQSRPVLIQSPPILVRPAPLRPITPAAITVQPPQQSPMVPPRIVVRPAPLPPITPPPIRVSLPRPGPIQPKPVVVRPPKLAPIQPPPITVTQPRPAPISPPPIFIRPPTPSAVQPPTICIPTSALFKGEPGIRYPGVPEPCIQYTSIPEPCSVPCPGPCSCPYCSNPCP